MNHFVKTRNLPYSIDNIRKVAESCPTCLQVKPKFIKSSGHLIKATQPFQQLNIYFKGPLPVSENKNRYLLTIIDEYSRFPFAFPCRDMTSTTVTQCFDQLFSLFGMPGYIHSDRAQDFLSAEVKQYLNSKGIASSKTSRYNPRGNGQTERYNGIIWKSIQLALVSRNLPVSSWESVLPDALHSIRSLLCTSTNATPHERMFLYNRKSTSGNSIPSWLTPGPVYIRKHVRNSKYDPLVERAELLQVNPQYAFVRLESGHQTTVSLRDVAPCDRPNENDSMPLTQSPGEGNSNEHIVVEDQPTNTSRNTENHQVDTSNIGDNISPLSTDHHLQPSRTTDVSEQTHSGNSQSGNVDNSFVPRKSTRLRKPRDLFAVSDHSSL